MLRALQMGRKIRPSCPNGFVVEVKINFKFQLLGVEVA